MRVKIAIAMILVVLFVAPLWAKGSKGPNVPSNTSALTAVEETNLLYLFEEEKLAHDIYVEMYDLWGAYIFNNISESEQRHMDAIANLIYKYDLDVSVFENDPGIFNNEDLQEEYDLLLGEGRKNLTSALGVGMRIEIMDIDDINGMLDETDKSDIKRVLNNLLNGSENHLNAFETQLGITP
jgi:hypothetical protein